MNNISVTAVTVLAAAVLTGCGHDTPPAPASPAPVAPAPANEGTDSQGAAIAQEGQHDDVIEEGIRKDGVRRIISYLSNADDELAHNPTPDRARALGTYKDTATGRACNLLHDVNPHDRDVNIRDWGTANCSGQ